MLTVKDYTQHPAVQNVLDELKTFEANRPQKQLKVSSIKDDQGNQYVDLVMEGGGTLGVALLGYLYVLEQMNIRFLRLAGTSAGGIVTLLLAASGNIQAAHSDWLIETVAQKNFFDFVDGNKEVRKFVRSMTNPDTRKTKSLRLSTTMWDDLRNDFGLCPGVAFHQWLTNLLKTQQIETLKELKAKRSLVPEGIRNENTNRNVKAERWERISLVTVDVTTGTKVALPDLAHLYWANPDLANPADFSRASMSVPAFFYPFIKKDIPNSETAQAAWDKDANYRGAIPETVHFIDGGSISNFPISLFYEPEAELDAPVFGIKIGIKRNKFNEINSLLDYSGAMLNTILSSYDNDMFMRNPELNRYVGEIDYGSYNWLDFSISDEGKLDLFVRGAKAGADFLKHFTWDAERDATFFSQLKRLKLF